jgi:hypothetical protein
MQTPSPIFIVGANRSGTTLLRLILNAHPRLAIPEELNFFNPWMAAHWRDAAPDRNRFRHRVHWHLHEKMPPGAFGTVALNDLEDSIVSEASTYDWRALYAGALNTWAHRHGKMRWGEKTPGNLFYVDHLLEMFPEAQFIHLVRDPRAGVQSMQNASFFGNDISINTLNRRKYLREGLRRDATMPPDQWMRIRYEDLLTAPDDTVRALCHFLGERFVPAMLTYYETAERYMSTAAAQGFNQAALRPIDPSKADSWRKTLPPADATVIETICRSEMNALNYVPDAPRPTLFSQIKILLATAFWHLSHVGHDAPEYVIGESLSEYLRRIPARLRSLVSVPRMPLPSDGSSSE